MLLAHVLISVLVLDICNCNSTSFKPAFASNLQVHSCPLWHVRRKDKCECGNGLDYAVECRGSLITIGLGSCMTWDNASHRAVLHHCPLFHKITCPKYGFFASIQIPINTTGAELNHITCDKYNRQGTHCKQCKNGYGPVPFSDGFFCADCSESTHLWLLNLLLQLTMVTLMYLAVILFQIKGTSSPLNVIITYSQLCVCPFSVSIGVRVRMGCYLGVPMTTILLTIIGVFNLDVFRFVIPPMCISTSLKSIDILLFDYIIAFYPIFLTIFIYIAIELHDRNCRIAVYLTIPVKKFFNLFKRNWNPKTTILNTCVTFILLAYSKLLFTSINLLFAVRSYNSDGDVVPNSTVLLYDPAIRFLHSEHIPYAVLALSVMVIFVLLPPLLLILYPTRLFKRFLNCCGFKRWDILQVIADIFQGWYKDGTEGTYDYRSLSAFYFLLRFAFGGLYIVLLYFRYHAGWYIFGFSHVFLGTFFLIAKPYKKNWMNFFDGIVILYLGVLLLLNIYQNKVAFVIGLVIGVVVLLAFCLVMCFQKLRIL